jgi:hypothetical protein
VVSLLLPPFLTAGESSETIFLLPVPFAAGLVSAVVCVLIGAAAGLTRTTKNKCTE